MTRTDLHETATGRLAPLCLALLLALSGNAAFSQEAASEDSAAAGESVPSDPAAEPAAGDSPLHGGDEADDSGVEADSGEEERKARVAENVDLSQPVDPSSMSGEIDPRGDIEASWAEPDIPVTYSDEQPSLFLLGTEVPASTSARLSWSPQQSFDGIDGPTPVLVINGATRGPVLCLTAAIHGDELNGIEIVRRVMYDLDPSKLSGAVIGVPIGLVAGALLGLICGAILTDKRPASSVDVTANQSEPPAEGEGARPREESGT